MPITYQFFVANLLVFFFIMRTTASAQSLGPYWIGIVFYIWTSVYNLFITSVFWCLMADVFRSEQAKRLFGFIGVGGTLGSITGSLVTALLAQRIGTVNLLLVSVALLETASLVVARFPRGAFQWSSICRGETDRRNGLAASRLTRHLISWHRRFSNSIQSHRPRWSPTS